MFRKVFLGLASVTFCLAAAPAAKASVIQTVSASEAYYMFGPNVSANSGARLLADKAADIGFPDLQSVSFLRFDQGDLPTTTLASRGLTARLTLQQDNNLASTLIPASNERPLSLSIYGLTNVFDAVNGNLADIDYGADGANAIATTLVGDNSLYHWDITSLIDEWITTPALNFGFALSGLFGNSDIDGRNSYGIFHTVGSTTGLAPSFAIVSVPEPSTFVILALGLLAVLLGHHIRAGARREPSLSAIAGKR